MRLMCGILAVAFGVPLVAEELDFGAIEIAAIEALANIQQQSIEDQVEYCGYIVIQNDKISATDVTKGGEDYCEMDAPPEDAEIVASFHTHGNHNPEYNSEVPSDADVEGDEEEGIYGFVGTPGGRVWLIDPFQDGIFSICDEACIPQDEDYNAADYPEIPQSFNEKELIGFLEEN